jgi:hypothetical protein
MLNYALQWQPSWISDWSQDTNLHTILSLVYIEYMWKCTNKSKFVFFFIIFDFFIVLFCLLTNITLAQGSNWLNYNIELLWLDYHLYRSQLPISWPVYPIGQAIGAFALTNLPFMSCNCSTNFTVLQFNL